MAISNSVQDNNTAIENSLQKLRFNLAQSYSLVVNNTRQFLQPYGITPKQYMILRNMAVCSPESRSIQDIRDSLADKMSDASRLIDRLEKKGFVEKFPSDFDRRSNRVRILDKGKELLRQIQEKRDHLDRFVNERLDEKEVNQLNELLTRLK